MKNMSIKFCDGNLFESDAMALVNTVNCVGVMGKGVAYQFKRAYRDMFVDYVKRCKENKVRLGEVYSYRTADKIVINFPTKGHWRSKSNIRDIEDGLKSLRTVLVSEEIRSVALPPLGCGNGGLEWPEVKNLIEKYLSDIETEVEVYKPYSCEFKSNVSHVPALSLSHLICLDLRSKLNTKSKISFHKTAYFAEQLAGERGYFKFIRHKFGPWSTSLDHVMRALTDYVDAVNVSASNYNSIIDRAEKVELGGSQSERLRKWRHAASVASELANSSTIDMEVAATIYEIVLADPGLQEDDVIENFFSWSIEKNSKFDKNAVAACLIVLEEKGFMRKTLAGYEVALPLDCK